MIMLTAEQVIGINARHLGGQPAVRDAGLVASAVIRPTTVVFGAEAFTSPYEKVAALLHSLICTHPFIDGNKRTAWASAEAVMIMNGVSCDLGDDAAFDLVMDIAASCSTIEVKDIAAQLAV